MKLDLSYCRIIRLDLSYCRILSLDLSGCSNLIYLTVGWSNSIYLTVGLWNLRPDLSYCRILKLDLSYCRIPILDFSKIWLKFYQISIIFWFFVKTCKRHLGFYSKFHLKKYSFTLSSHFVVLNLIQISLKCLHG